MRYSVLFVFCVLIHVMFVVCDHVGCIVVGLLFCFDVFTIFVCSLSILFLFGSKDGVVDLYLCYLLFISW